MLMLKHLKHPGTMIAAVALFAAFGGGAAAYASGLISGSQIENHSIPAKKLTASAIESLQGALSHTYQKRESGNLNIGADDTHPVTLTSLKLPGSASYLVSATGTLFPSTQAASADCSSSIQLDLDSFPGIYHGLTYNQAGASVDASGNELNGTYSVTQLVTLPSGSHTLRIDAFRFEGTTGCTSYGNVLTATLVDRATGETKAAAHRGAKAQTGFGPRR